MVNILFSTNNLFYQIGIVPIIKSVLPVISSDEVSISSVVNEDNVANADIIIIDLKPGELYMCHPEIRTMKQSCLLIGITDKKTSCNALTLPSCISDIFLIDRSLSIEETTELLRGYFIEKQDINYKHLKKIRCFNCKRRGFSRIQIEIIKGIKNGLSVKQLSNELNMSEQNIYAHKYQLMSKFQLSNTVELVSFLDYVSKKKFNLNHDGYYL